MPLMPKMWHGQEHRTPGSLVPLMPLSLVKNPEHAGCIRG
jgi:hypothetical protein